MDSAHLYSVDNHNLVIASAKELLFHPNHYNQSLFHKSFEYVYLDFLQTQISTDHLMTHKKLRHIYRLLMLLLLLNKALKLHEVLICLIEIFLDCCSTLENHFQVVSI